MKLSMLVAASIVTLLCARSSIASSPKCEAEFSAEQKVIEAKRVTLPALKEICDSLSISQEKCEGEYSAFWAASNNLTDPSLWYSGAASSPTNAPPQDCYQAVAIERYGMYGGGTGTTYACKVKPEDDHISDAELARIAELAKRMNSISPKTLQDHRRALTVKRLIAYLGG